MRLLETQTNNNKNKLLWTLPYIIVGSGLLFAFIGLSEFYNVKIAGGESSYPFGPTNENPWYYQNASIYANYNLTMGLLFVSTSLVTAFATIKKNKKLLVFGVCVAILLFIVELISAKVQ